jgi:hypothetical protein
MDATDPASLPLDLPPLGRPRRKVDHEALRSPLNRIPGIDLKTVRDLLDIGLREVDELRGRAPESLFEEILDLREQTPRDRLWTLRMAVYFAETPEPDATLLQPWKWQ